MRLCSVLMTLFLISMPGIAREMFDKGSVETGFSFQIEHQWGDRYENYSVGEATYLDCSAVTGYFVDEGIAVGLFVHGVNRWTTNTDGYIDIGPRLAYYFFSYSDGAFYGDTSVRFGRNSDNDYLIIAAGLGHLFKLNRHIGLTTGVEYRAVEYSEEDMRDYTEIEVRGGLRIFLFGGNK